jgi:hypothetical protein
MISLTNYNSIEIGDTITLPTSMNLVKSGVVASIKKHNAYAMCVTCTNGAKFELNHRVRDFVLTVEESN